MVHTAGDQVGRALQGRGGFIDPGQQRRRRHLQTIQVGDQFGGARIRRHLPLRQMLAQRTRVGAVLHRLAHLKRKRAVVPLARSAR